MSAERNPDTRPLPAGWIEQYDPNYKTWFYVDTGARPPMSSWQHPATLVTSPPPYPPPSTTRGVGYPPQQGYGNPQSQGGYGQGQGSYPGYDRSPQPNWQPYPSQEREPAGYAFRPDSSSSQPDWYRQQQQQQQQQQQAQPKHNSGMVPIAGAAVAGLLGGAIIEHLVEEKGEGYDEGFDQGYNDGDTNDGDNGGWF